MCCLLPPPSPPLSHHTPQVLLVILSLSLVTVIAITVSSCCLQYQTLRFYSASLLLLCICMLSQGIVFLLDLDQLATTAAACSILIVFLKTTIYMSVPRNISFYVQALKHSRNQL